jgi:hypothetical protein
MEIAALKDGDRKGMRVVARRLVQQALKGNMLALKEIADRHDGKVAQTQVIVGDEDASPVRYIAEVPRKAATTEEWLESIRQDQMPRPLVTGVVAGVDDQQAHSAESDSAINRG